MITRCLRFTAILLSIPILAGCTIGHAARDHRELAAALQALKAAAVADKKGTITGNLYLLHPAVPTLLREHPVMLLPLTPRLEAAIKEAGERFARTREPLSPEALSAARRLLDDAVTAIKALGEEWLIERTQTELKEAGFTFAKVPEGRWLLTAELETPISVLLWAAPVSVTSDRPTLQRLNDGNVWLEGLKR